MQNNAKSNLYRFIAQLRAELGISKTDYPLDVLKLCKRECTTDIVLHAFSTDGFCAAAYAGTATDTIILNEHRNAEERNFDCGHEVIHLTKHRGINDGVFNCSEKMQYSFYEWEANEGSAEFIMPYKAFIADVGSAYASFDRVGRITEFKRDMMYTYHVTPAMIDNRLNNLRYEIQQYLDGTSISELLFLSWREQQAQGIVCKSIIDLQNELAVMDMPSYGFRRTQQHAMACSV